MHVDSISPLLLALALILLAAKVGGHLAIRLKQPAVLGELVFGILLGNLKLFGIHQLEELKTMPTLEALSSLGVIFLLFSVGLESTLKDMMSVGLSSFIVAVVGVIVPMALGLGVTTWLMPEHSFYAHLFVGATLCATSVGITARVLSDAGKSQSPEGRVILGAAVIDDVLGLIVLVAVAGLVSSADQGKPFSVSELSSTVGSAVAFLVGAILIGRVVSKRVLHVASKLQGEGVLLGFSLVICLLLSFLASLVGLAPIVGAFAGGMILSEVKFKDLNSSEPQELENLMEPILAFLAPVFFVLMGVKVDLSTFTDLQTLEIAAALTFVAILGKQACALGVVQKGIRRLPVGLGMIPRGEVGLIFANIGLTLHIGGERIIDPATFSAIVIMVVATTLVTPPLLKKSL